MSSTRIARADRHALNVALHHAGLPTLGSAHTLAELTAAQRKVVKAALAPTAPAPKARAPKATRVEPTKAAVKEFGYVRALIRANKAA
jgi:hypothetical protein